MDDVLCDFKTAHKEAIQQNPKIKFPQSQYGFFRNLKPSYGGIETVNFLRRSHPLIKTKKTLSSRND